MPFHWSMSITIPVGAALFLCGCPNPNTYTTPRTLDPGKIQWQVAPEFIGVSYNVPTVANNGNGTVQNNVSGALPMIPSFGARFGVVDGFELGLHVDNLDSLQADGKIRLVKGAFDVSVDPGLQGYYVSINNVSLGVVYLHLPVLLGLNLSPKVSLVLSPGLVYSIATATASDASGVTGVSNATGVMGRLGLGIDLRITHKFAIHPELTVMKQFSDANALIYVGGVGFNFGAQPDYSDLEGPAAAAQ